MSHIDLEHHVSLRIVSDNTELLNSLEGELPAGDAENVGSEYDGPNRKSDLEDGSEGQEQITARVTFVDKTVTDSDGNETEYDGETEAGDLFTRLKNHDLSGADYTIRHYQSPVGGVTAGAVREWYEEDPTRQPEDEDGEKYVPSSFDPENHIIKELSG